jgi:hypothetical protein
MSRQMSDSIPDMTLCRAKVFENVCCFRYLRKSRTQGGPGSKAFLSHPDPAHGPLGLENFQIRPGRCRTCGKFSRNTAVVQAAVTRFFGPGAVFACLMVRNQQAHHSRGKCPGTGACARLFDSTEIQRSMLCWRCPSCATRSEVLQPALSSSSPVAQRLVRG